MKALSENRVRDDDYYEAHHILPKCMGGDEIEYLVLLTGREHFLCHYLLRNMFDEGSEERKKMNSALWRMCNNGSKERYYIVRSRTYESARKEHAENHRPFMTGNTYRKGLVPTNAFPKGHEPWNKGKTNVYSDEWLKNQSERYKGVKNPKHSEFMKGNKHALGNRGCHTAWNKDISYGLYFTPDGIFYTRKAMKKYYNFDLGSIIKYCKSPDNIITERMTRTSPILIKEWIGMSLYDVGFNFIPKEKGAD